MKPNAPQSRHTKVFAIHAGKVLTCANVRQWTWARWALCLLLLCLSSVAQAQSEVLQDQLPTNRKITTTARMLGVSHAQVLDTYLSPEHYTGCDLRYISQTQREREGQRLSQLITQTGNVAYLKNRAESGNEIAGMYNFSYALHYGFHWFDRRLQLQVGGRVETNVGFIYNTHNSNNPAQARVFLHLAPSAVASYKAQVGNVPLLLRYELAVPMLGVMFSPNYGQSYYEIFSKGNYDHNVVPTTIVSAPSLRQMLTVDFPVLRSTVRFGYMGDIQQSHVNGLKTHVYTHGVVIGLVKRFSLIKLAP